MANQLWHALRVDNIAAYWQTNLSEGLNPNEIKKRLNEFGFNDLSDYSDHCPD